jgi:predicted FMN-binding regulatory protein PaiB
MADKKAAKVKKERKKPEMVVVLTSQGWFDPEKYDVKQRQSKSIPETWINWLVNSSSEVAIFEKDKMDPRLTGEAFTDNKDKWLTVPYFVEPDDAVEYLWKHRKSDTHFGAQVPAKIAYQVITEKPVIAKKIEMPLMQPTSGEVAG